MINITFFIADVYNMIEQKLTQSTLLWFFICNQARGCVTNETIYTQRPAECVSHESGHRLPCGAFRKCRFLGPTSAGSGLAAMKENLPCPPEPAVFTFEEPWLLCARTGCRLERRQSIPCVLWQRPCGLVGLGPRLALVISCFQAEASAVLYQCTPPFLWGRSLCFLIGHDRFRRRPGDISVASEQLNLV